MSDITINPNPTTDAEYIAAINQMLAEIQRNHDRFDELHAEVVAMKERAEQKAARGDELQAEIDRLIKKIWGH